eukprot:s1657_g16.t1
MALEDVQKSGTLDQGEMLAIQTILLPAALLVVLESVKLAGNPFITMPASNRYHHPGTSYSRHDWPFRSTAFQREDFTWEFAEFCNQYHINDELDGEIEGCFKPTFVLTMLHKKEEEFNVSGLVGSQELVEAGGAQLDFTFAEEPPVPAEMMDGLKPEELAQHDPPPEGSDPAPVFSWEFENKESLVINGEILTGGSSMVLLRAAADYLGVSQGGFKKALWDRINQRSQTIEHEQLFLEAIRLHRERQWQHGLVGQSIPREPTDEEVALHELSHLPYQTWCPYCVACKGRQDAQKKLEVGEEGRAIPSIQLDYCFCESKYVTVYPLLSKGHNLKSQAEHLVRFSMSLKHMTQVEFISDAEPTMKALLASIQLLQQHLGYPTTATHSRPGDKGRTAHVERVIQTLRRQSSTLVHMASDKCGLNLPGDHAFWAWAFVHAAWTMNRFQNHATTQMSPFELVFDRRYAGKVAAFGEGDDLHVVATPNGLLRAKAIRRLSDPWRSTWLFMVKEKPFQHVLTKKANLKTLRFGAPITPRPVVDQHPTIPEDEEVDYDARDVREYARSHPPSPVSDIDDMLPDENTKRGGTPEALSPGKFARTGDGPETSGKPSTLSPAERDALDEAAGYKEIARLLDMEVLKEPTPEDLEQGTLLSTRSVMDWRFRDQQWQRSFLDIQDAFLSVPQREKVLVEKPSWWRDETGLQCHFWTLNRCLPGQRNAAARFFDFLREHLQSSDFENTWLLIPSLFRHENRSLVICSHVDDLVLCGERPGLEWLVEELKKKFTMQGGEILPTADQDPHEPIRFLKKRHFFTEAGIVISPHEKYTEELLKLYGLESRKAKATPDMACENYESPELNEEGKHRFRSAMGTLLYLSQDRVDLQHAVRHLSQFMAKPTTAAEAGVKHAIQYLKGTTELGILLSYNVQKSKLDEPDRGYAGDLVEAFTDADWAGDISPQP